MKLKRIVIAIMSLILAGALLLVVYTKMNEQKQAFKTIYVATKDIKQGEKITDDKVIQLKTDITSPFSSPADISKYAKEDITKGRIITKDTLLDTVYEDVYTHIIIKIESTPYDMLKDKKEISIMNFDKQDNRIVGRNIYNNIKLIKIYDQAGREVGKNSNEYTSNLASIIEIATDKDTAQKIKEKEKSENFVVLTR